MTNTENYISAAIVSYNGKDKVSAACRSLKENTKKYPLNLYVIDNNSTDNTAEELENSGVTVIKNDKNIGFGAAHNKVLMKNLCKYHFVVNPDILISSDVLSDMADFMDNNPDIVMCMPKILNEDGTEQKLPKEKPTAKRLFLGRLAPLSQKFRKIRDDYTWSSKEITEVTDIDFCSGCFFCIRGDVFQKLSGFDERFFMYLEDADITARAKKYGRTVINPDFSVTHLWERESAKSFKYLMIHTNSAIKFLIGKRRKSG